MLEYFSIQTPEFQRMRTLLLPQYCNDFSIFEFRIWEINIPSLALVLLDAENRPY